MIFYFVSELNLFIYAVDMIMKFINRSSWDNGETIIDIYLLKNNKLTGNLLATSYKHYCAQD